MEARQKLSWFWKSLDKAPPPPPPSQTSTVADLSLNLRPGSKTTSAPSSPAKSRESLLQRVQSLTGQARDQGASILGAAVSSATRVTSSVSGRYLTLLVVDDQNTDWSKYFRGKRIGDYDIRVEQAEFKEITVTANSDGANVSMAVFRGGTRVGRSFRPDFLLVNMSKVTAHKRIRHPYLPEIRWKFSGFSCPATVKVVLIKSVQRRS
ncbi:hypothetical protein GEV33_001128 [Tenebrio molitor]|uniref:Synapsin pre-ATP-grasp domain-containing protein n=1 Tax=Tenebrio molitor TaxID=7067 RepID=A0A8J6LJU0_TENMO|nr:hypothetical protein GEV33_001128 [Tenebrio molitor]